MSEPVTLAVIGTGAAVVGAVQSAWTAVNGETGFHVSASHIHYPKEFPANQFAHAGQSVRWDIMRFEANGVMWDNQLVVAASGYVSNDRDEPVGWADSENPNIAVNRFVILQFTKSGNSENLSSGLLTVNISPWGGNAVELAEGDGEDPWVALLVHGRFDPVGEGDVQYDFKLMINTLAQVSVSDVNWNGTGEAFDVMTEGDQVVVTLTQPQSGWATL
jgi:hypothetical protein